MAVSKKATFELEGKTKGKEAWSSFQTNVVSIQAGLQLAGKAAEFFTEAIDLATQGVTAFVRTGSQFEQYTVQFETLLGNIDEAKTRMKELFDFATSTPFELDVVVQTAKTMEAFGIFTERNLRAAGDAAAAFGVQMEDAALAIAGGITGEMERLKRFGITSAEVIEQLGHKIDRTTRAGMEEVGIAIVELFEEKAGGGMAKLADTLEGKINNLKDAWTRFKLEVSDASVFETVDRIVGVMLNTVNEFLTDTGRDSARAIGNTIADALWQVAIVLAGVAEDLHTVVAVLTGQQQKRPLDAQLIKDAFAATIHEFTGGTFGRRMELVQPLGIQQNLIAAQARFQRQDVESFAGQMIADIMGVQPGVSLFERNLARGGQGVSVRPPADRTRAELQWAAFEQQEAARRAQEREIAASLAGTRTPGGRGGIRGVGGPTTGELLAPDVSDMEEVARAGEDANRRLEQSADDAWTAMILGSRGAVTAYETFATETFRVGQKWAMGQKTNARDVYTAIGNSLRAGAVDYMMIEGKKAGLEALKEGAKAVAALASGQPGAAAGHALAAAKWVAVAAAFGIGAGVVSSPESPPAPAGQADMEEEEVAGGSRVISRSAGVRTQNLYISVNIQNLGPAVYGPGGWQQLIDEVIAPEIEEALLIGGK